MSIYLLKLIMLNTDEVAQREKKALNIVSKVQRKPGQSGWKFVCLASVYTEASEWWGSRDGWQDGTLFGGGQSHFIGLGHVKTRA